MMNCYILPLFIQYKLILDIVVTNPPVSQHETKMFLVLYSKQVESTGNIPT